MDEIYARRSYHGGFDGKTKIDEPVMDKILKAGMNAPSAMNTMPWEFLVINEPDKLKQLSRLTFGTHATATASHAVLLCAKTSDDYNALNIGIAAENMLLEATHLGIQSLTMGIWPNNDQAQANIRNLTGLTDGFTAFLMLAFGYANKKIAPNNRWLPKKIHRNVW